MTYDPERPVNPEAWLAMDESVRIQIVEAYHERLRAKIPNAHLHATFHVVVENQLALGEQVVIETLDRLQSEGLSRHDAIHAIGSVVAQQVNQVMSRGEAAGDRNAGDAYRDNLSALTADIWRQMA